MSIRRYLKIAFLSIATAAAIFAGLAFWALRHSVPPMPKLPGTIERGALEHGGRTRTWIAYLPARAATHPALRSPEGERIVLEENRFVEWLLPARVMRKLTDAEMDEYRCPFREPGEGRRPTLSWPRQLPIEGEPAEVVEIVRAGAAWLAENPVPKLFINGAPGTLSKEEIQFYRSCPNTTAQ